MRTTMGTKLGIASSVAMAALLLASTLVQMPVLASAQGQGQEPVGEEAPPLDSSSLEDKPDLLEDLQPEGWTAGETSVSGLSDEEKAALVGVPLEVIEWEQAQVDQAEPELSVSYSYPSSVDWRDVQGGDWTTPIRNQASCNSCVAFATIGPIESRLEIAMGDPNLNPDLSESHLFYSGSGSCANGWNPASAMAFARDTGIVDEACYPYTDQQGSGSLCSDWQDRVTTISDWVETWDLDVMKQALADHGPFEATMTVYDDFFYYVGGVYSHTSGAYVGNHAVTIVGYNDEEGYWIAKNSWGTDWGEDGWFNIAYGECGVDSYVYVPIIAEPSYSLATNVTPEGAGTIVIDPRECVGDVCTSGTAVDLTAVPEPGYEFSGWGGDAAGGDNPITIILDSDKSVTAEFGAAGTTAVTLSSFSAQAADSSLIPSMGIPAALAGLVVGATTLAWLGWSLAPRPYLDGEWRQTHR